MQSLLQNFVIFIGVWKNCPYYSRKIAPLKISLLFVDVVVDIVLL